MAGRVGVQDGFRTSEISVSERLCATIYRASLVSMIRAVTSVVVVAVTMTTRRGALPIWTLMPASLEGPRRWRASFEHSPNSFHACMKMNGFLHIGYAAFARGSSPKMIPSWEMIHHSLSQPRAQFHTLIVFVHHFLVD